MLRLAVALGLLVVLVSLLVVVGVVVVVVVLVGIIITIAGIYMRTCYDKYYSFIIKLATKYC